MKSVQQQRTLEVGIKAFIFDENQRFLLLKRAKPYSGQKICKWDIPGGRIIPGEKIFKALKREIREETGLTLERIEKILAVQDILRVSGKHTVRITVLAKNKAGKVRVNLDEHSQYKWFTLNEIKKVRADLFLKPVIKDLMSELL